MANEEGQHREDGGLTWLGKLAAVEEQEDLRQYRRPRAVVGSASQAPPTEIDLDPNLGVEMDD